MHLSDNPQAGRPAIRQFKYVREETHCCATPSFNLTDQLIVVQLGNRPIGRKEFSERRRVSVPIFLPAVRESGRIVAAAAEYHVLWEHQVRRTRDILLLPKHT